jgi:hypothetical protein
MKRACCLISALAAAVSVLTGCGGASGPHRTVQGSLIRVGGPAAFGKVPSPVPLPGVVVAKNRTGTQFTASAGKDGRFQLSLPPGTYRLTGHSPQVMVNGQQMLCTGTRTVQVTKTEPVHGADVVCSIP